MITKDTKVDSPEGIAHLIQWAKGNGVYLNRAHIEIARKHGVDTAGVLVAQPIPLS